MKTLLIGIVAGLLFFTALVVMMIAGLSEPYVYILIAFSGAAVFAATYLKASRARGQRDEDNG